MHTFSHQDKTPKIMVHRCVPCQGALLCADKMASSSSSLIERIAPKPIVFKFQGALKKSCFQDGHLEIKDTELGHIEWNTFLILYNKPKERSTMVSSLIQSGLVNVVSHPTSVQSLEIIMALAKNYVLEERFVKSVTREIVLNLRPRNIEKVFHLSRID